MRGQKKTRRVSPEVVLRRRDNVDRNIARMRRRSVGRWWMTVHLLHLLHLLCLWPDVNVAAATVLVTP